VTTVPTNVANRLRIGTVHERINLDPKWYLGAYNFYLRAVASRLQEAFGTTRKRPSRASCPLMKLVFLDIGLSVDTYIYARERTMRKQQEAIRNSPHRCCRSANGCCCYRSSASSISQRGRLITKDSCDRIRANRTKVVVMDITGVANDRLQGRQSPASDGHGLRASWAHW